MNVEDQRHEKPLSPWNRGKRIIVLTVFFLGLRGIDTPGKQALEECNKLYGLVNDPDALRFASLLAPRVWSGETWRHGLAELSSGHLSRAVQHFTKTDRKSTRLNSSHVKTSYAVLCLK